MAPGEVPMRQGLLGGRPIPNFEPVYPSLETPGWIRFAPLNKARREQVANSVPIFQLRQYQSVVTPYRVVDYRSWNKGPYVPRTFHPVRDRNSGIPADISYIADTHMLGTYEKIFMPLRSTYYLSDVSSTNTMAKRLDEACATFGASRLDLNVFAGSKGHARISGPVQFYCPSKGFSAVSTYGHSIELPRVIDETMVQLPEESVLSGIVLSESASSGECCEQYKVIERARSELPGELIGGNPSNVVLAFLSAVTRARPNTPIISFLDGDGGGFEIARRLASFGAQFRWFSSNELRQAGCQLKQFDSDWDVKKIKSVLDEKEWPEDMRSLGGEMVTTGWGYSFCTLARKRSSMDMVVRTIVDALSGELPRVKSDQLSPAVLDEESYLQDTHLFEWIGRPLIGLEGLVFGQVLPTIEGDVSDPTVDISINLPAGYAHAKPSTIIIQPALSRVVLRASGRGDEVLKDAIRLIHDNCPHPADVQQMLTNGSRLAEYYPDDQIGQEAHSLNEWVARLVPAMAMFRMSLPGPDQREEAQAVLAFRLLAERIRLPQLRKEALKSKLGRKRGNKERGSTSAAKRKRGATSNATGNSSTTTGDVSTEVSTRDATTDTISVADTSANDASFDTGSGVAKGKRRVPANDDSVQGASTLGAPTSRASATKKGRNVSAKRTNTGPLSSSKPTDLSVADPCVIDVSSDHDSVIEISSDGGVDISINGASTSKVSSGSGGATRKRKADDAPAQDTANTSTGSKDGATKKRRKVKETNTGPSTSSTESKTDETTGSQPSEETNPVIKCTECSRTNTARWRPGQICDACYRKRNREEKKATGAFKGFKCGCGRTDTRQWHTGPDGVKICHACDEKARRTQKKAEAAVNPHYCGVCSQTKLTIWHSRPDGTQICSSCYAKVKRERNKAEAAEKGGKCILCGEENSIIWHPGPDETQICDRCDHNVRRDRRNAKAAEEGAQCECGATETREWYRDSDGAWLCSSCYHKDQKEVMHEKAIEDCYRCDQCGRHESPRWYKEDDMQICGVCYKSARKARKNAEAAAQGVKCKECDRKTATDWCTDLDGTWICIVCYQTMREKRKAEDAAAGDKCDSCNKTECDNWHRSPGGLTLCHTCWLIGRKTQREDAAKDKTRKREPDA